MDTTSDIKLISIILVISFAFVTLLYCMLDYYGCCNWQWTSCCSCCYDENGNRVGRNRINVEPSDT